MAKIPIMPISTKVYGTAPEMYLTSCHLNVVMLSTFSARYSMLPRLKSCKKREAQKGTFPQSYGGKLALPFRSFVCNQIFPAINYFVK